MSKGEYKIKLDDECKIVRVVAIGDINKKLGEEIITNARKKAAKHKYSILCDVSKADAKVSLKDWFFLPRTLPVLKNPETSHITAAILVPIGEQEQAYHFYEAVTQNIGMKLRIFKNEKDAIKWLQSVR